MSIEDIVSVSGNPEAPKAATPVVAEPKESKEASPASDESDELSTDETHDDSGPSEEKTDEESQDDEADSKDQPKRKGGVQKRFDKLTRKLTEREREIEYWKQEALKAKPESKVEAPKEQAAQAAKADGEPNPDDFETVTEYFKALNKFQLKQERDAEAVEKRKIEVQESYKTQMKSHLTRVEEFKKQAADFVEALEDVDDIPLSGEFQGAIITSDVGPQVIYELSKNRAELERVSKLQGAALAKAIGRLEAKVEAASASQGAETPQPQKSAAPAPIKPVGQSSKASGKKSLNDMGIEEYMEWRRKNR